MVTKDDRMTVAESAIWRGWRRMPYKWPASLPLRKNTGRVSTELTCLLIVGNESGGCGSLIGRREGFAMFEGAPMPARLLRTAEAGRFLGLSGRTLEKHRTYGTGPIYRKIGGRVVYAIEDLQNWADRGARRSTSDPAPNGVPPARS